MPHFTDNRASDGPPPSLRHADGRGSGEARPIQRIRPDADGTRWEGVVIPHVRQVPGCRAQVIPHKPQWGVRTVDEHGPCVKFARACEMEVVDG